MKIHIISNYSNSYIIELEKSSILIDCGFDRKATQIIKKLKEINKPLNYILITHSHIDHILGLYEVYKNFPYAKIVAHVNSAEYLAGKKFKLPKGLQKIFFEILIPFLNYKGFRPHIAIFEDEEIEVENLKIKLIHTPGHTEDHLCILADKRLFIGDLLENLNGKLSFPPKEFNDSEEEMIKSIDKLLNFEFEEIYFGHGNPILQNAKEHLENFLSSKISTIKI